MGKLFISYRRADSDFTHRMAEKLQQTLEGVVFFDQKITKDDFAVALDTEVEQCNVFALVVTENTFAPQRIQQGDDWVRREIRLALTMNKPCVLIFREGQSLPPPDQLPEDIRRIGTKQGITLYLSMYDECIQQLAEHCVAISNGGLRLKTVSAQVQAGTPIIQQTFEGIGVQLGRDLNGTVEINPQHTTNIRHQVTQHNQYGQKQYWMKMEAPLVTSDPYMQSSINQAYDMGNQIANNTALNEGTRSLAFAFGKVAFYTLFMFAPICLLPWLRTRMHPQVIQFHRTRLKKIFKGWLVIGAFGILMPVLFAAGIFGVIVTGLSWLVLNWQEKRSLKQLASSEVHKLPVVGNGFGWLALLIQGDPVRWTIIQDGVLSGSLLLLFFIGAKGNLTNSLVNGLFSFFILGYFMYYQHKFGPWFVEKPKTSTV